MDAGAGGTVSVNIDRILLPYAIDIPHYNCYTS